MKLDKIIINEKISKELVDLYSQKSIDNILAPIINLGVGNTIIQEKLIEKVKEIKKELNSQNTHDIAINQSRKNLLKIFNKVERKILKRNNNYTFFSNYFDFNNMYLVSDNMIYTIENGYLSIAISDRKINKKKDNINFLLDNSLLKIYFFIEDNNLKLHTIIYNDDNIKELFNLLHLNSDNMTSIILDQMMQEIMVNFNTLRLTYSLYDIDNLESDEASVDGSDSGFSVQQLLNKIINLDNYLMNDCFDYYKKMLLLKDILELEKDYVLNLISKEEIESVTMTSDNYHIKIFETKRKTKIRNYYGTK